MTAATTHWLAYLWASDAPVLPSTHAMHVWLCLGWGILGATLAVSLVARWSRRRLLLWAGASCGFVWAWIPGQFSPTHWLGLAFQMPSIGLVLLGALAVARQLMRDPNSPMAQPTRSQATPPNRLALAAIGTVAGWVLLLDTLALLPLQVYAWGFSPAAVGLALALLLLPWMFLPAAPSDAAAWLGPLACVLFVALRLPTGNLWDALLDPWLWIALQAYLVREVIVILRRKPLSV